MRRATYNPGSRQTASKELFNRQKGSSVNLNKHNFHSWNFLKKVNIATVFTTDPSRIFVAYQLISSPYQNHSCRPFLYSHVQLFLDGLKLSLFYSKLRGDIRPIKFRPFIADCLKVMYRKLLIVLEQSFCTI